MHVYVQIPIGAEDRFEGVVDLVRMKGITWDGEVSSTHKSYSCLLLMFVTWFVTCRAGVSKPSLGHYARHSAYKCGQGNFFGYAG